MRGSTSLPRIVVSDVHRALAQVLPRLHPEPTPPLGVHPTAVLGRGVTLAEDVSIGPYVVIGAGSRIGRGCTLGPHVVLGEGVELAEQVTIHAGSVLYRRVRVGARTIIHSGVRLGADGFGYVPVDGKPHKIPQVGQCIIGADVEIGANSTIDRGSIGNTEIGDGVKIDNLVHIGHNVRIGAYSILVAQVGISGSVTVGQRVTMAGQVGVIGHVRITDDVILGGKAAVWADVDKPGLYSGNPVRPHKERLRAQAAMLKLPELIKRLRALEKKVFGKAEE